MDIRTRNVTALGLLVLVAAAVFVWGLYYLQGDALLAGGRRLYLALGDGAGLKRGDRVWLSGVDVGQVRAVELAAPGRVVVELRLDGGVVLPSDTRARVQGDVFGKNTVELLAGRSPAPLEDGDTIPGEPVPVLGEVIGELSGKARALLGEVDSLLSPRAVADVHATAAVLPAGARELRAAFEELHLAAAALRRRAEGVAAAEPGPAAARTLREFESSARAFGAAAGRLEQSLAALASVLEKVDRGAGTLGRLVNDTSLYAEFERAVREVRALVADVRERPDRYVSIRLF